MPRLMRLLAYTAVLVSMSLYGQTAWAQTTPGYAPPAAPFFRLDPAAPPQTRPVEPETVPVPNAAEQETMVEIPAGDFLMGAETGFADERPQRRLYVRRFFIDKYEVSNRRFQAVGMQPVAIVDPRHTVLDLPVVGVSWLQARQYCEKVGRRLPSEVEWEKAARGTDGRLFPWGNFWDPALANDGHGPRPVGSFPHGASPYGALDMAGNVWEWVADRYHAQPVAYMQERRVLRGGAWSYAAVFMRTSYRRHERSGYSEHRIGFRCASDAP